MRNKNDHFLPFEEAKAFAKALKLRNSFTWRQWCKSASKPINLPSFPNQVYKNNGWKSWGDFLGNGKIANDKRAFRPFEQAREFAKSLQLKNVKAWSLWAQGPFRPLDVPANPALTYKDDWRGWKDWLGSNSLSKHHTHYRAFKDAQAYVQTLSLDSYKKWREWAKTDKRPQDIPANPARTYEKDWLDWSHFLKQTTTHPSPLIHNMTTDKDPIKRTAFKKSWEKPSNNAITSSEGQMREWQKEAFEELKDAPFSILNAPTGSGKSYLMCALSAFRMNQDSDLKCVIAVPQTSIAPGFTNEKITLPNGEKIDWETQHNLFGQRCNYKSTVNYFIKWLKNAHGPMKERTLLCTHATLVRVFQRLKELEQLDLLKNILIWIDEAHHIKNTSIEGMDFVDNNELGKLVLQATLKTIPNFQIGLTTASFCRGDRCTLITNEMEAEFKRYNLPFDRHLAAMKHLKSFSFDFVLCGPDYIQGIKAVLRERKGRDIIHIPHPRSNYSSGNKYSEVEHILQEYQAVYGGEKVESPDGTIVFHSPEGNTKILDLVDDRLYKRKASDNYVHSTLKQNPEDLTGVIAINKFQEGTDWRCADRSIIVGDRLLPVALQIIGRLFRDYKGKEHVEVFQIIQISFDQNSDDFLEKLENYFKAIFASLLLEDILDPKKIQIPALKQENSQTTPPIVTTKSFALSELVPDETKLLLLREDTFNHLLDLSATNEQQGGDVADLKKRYDASIISVLEKHGLSDVAAPVAEHLWSECVKRSIKMQGLNVEDIDCDLLKKTHPLDCFIRYTSGIIDGSSFAAFRNALGNARQRVWRPFEEARCYTRTLGLKNAKEWILWAKTKEKPLDIPSWPNEVYPTWTKWGDWLGTDHLALKSRLFIPFEEARNYVRTLGLKNTIEWQQWAKTKSRPENIPAAAYKIYKNSGWKSWGDFLGTENLANKDFVFMDFAEARDYMHSLRIKSKSEYAAWIKSDLRHPSIPSNPAKTYKNSGWKSWGDFLGSGVVAPQRHVFKAFCEARDFARSLKLKNTKEWCAWTQSLDRPKDIPSNPQRSYKKDWLGWENWLHN